jgi:hypothetical protein
MIVASTSRGPTVMWRTWLDAAEVAARGRESPISGRCGSRPSELFAQNRTSALHVDSAARRHVPYDPADEMPADRTADSTSRRNSSGSQLTESAIQRPVVGRTSIQQPELIHPYPPRRRRRPRISPPPHRRLEGGAGRCPTSASQTAARDDTNSNSAPVSAIVLLSRRYRR